MEIKKFLTCPKHWKIAKNIHNALLLSPPVHVCMYLVFMYCYMFYSGCFTKTWHTTTNKTNVYDRKNLRVRVNGFCINSWNGEENENSYKALI